MCVCGEARGVCAWEERGGGVDVLSECVCADVWRQDRREREEEGGQCPTRAQRLTSVASVAPLDVCYAESLCPAATVQGVRTNMYAADGFHEADGAHLPTTFVAATLS